MLPILRKCQQFVDKISAIAHSHKSDRTNRIIVSKRHIFHRQHSTVNSLSRKIFLTGKIDRNLQKMIT
jgi:hypothetical protein